MQNGPVHDGVHLQTIDWPAKVHVPPFWQTVAAKGGQAVEATVVPAAVVVAPGVGVGALVGAVVVVVVG